MIHAGELATRFFDITTDVLIGTVAGALGAAGFKKISALVQTVKHPQQAPAAVGEALGDRAVEAVKIARGATQLHIRNLARAKTPLFYDFLRKAADGWAGIRDQTGHVIATEDKIWNILEETYNELPGTKDEKDAKLVQELEHLEHFIASGDVKRFMEELQTTTDNEVAHFLAYSWAKLQEGWPKIRAAIQPSDAAVNAIKSNRSALETRLAAMKAGAGRKI